MNQQELDQFICDNCGQWQDQDKAIIEETPDRRLLLFCSTSCRNKFIIN